MSRKLLLAAFGVVSSAALFATVGLSPGCSSPSPVPSNQINGSGTLGGATASAAANATTQPAPTPPATTPAPATTAAAPAATPAAGAALTYTASIQGILATSCVGCHAAGGTPPDLSTYAAAKAGAASSLSAIQGGSMPPASSPAMAASAKTDFQSWVTGGTPQ